MTKLVSFSRAIRGFHEDEEGLEALQVVMIIAIAAVILLFIRMYWRQISNWFAGLISQIIHWQ